MENVQPSRASSSRRQRITLNSITVREPFQWIAQGWADLRRAPLASLLYGGFFAGLGWGLLLLSETFTHFAMLYMAGFFLVGPFLAMGAYAVARQLETRDQANIAYSLGTWRRSGLDAGLFAALLGIILMFWIRLSWLLIGLAFYHADDIGLGALLNTVVGGGPGLNYLILYLASGAAFALFVFMISVVSLPMLEDRQTDIVTAVSTSFKAVIANPLPMLVWAALIVLITGIGMATYLIGLIIAFPWLGYATWHAYRSTVHYPTRG